MDSLISLFQAHLLTLQQRAQQALAYSKLDAMLIHSGELLAAFLDDQHYPFKVNPHFKNWVPVTQVPNCWLWIDGVNKPTLWFWSPVDYWHKTLPLPGGFWTGGIEIVPLRDVDEIKKFLPVVRQRVAYIGPSAQRAAQLEISANNINPKALLDYLHYYRAYKTDYELFCMRQAQKIAVAGHRAAQEAFLSGMSEFDINLAYLTATGHRDSDVPYDNIVALNEHAAILHYTSLEQQVPDEIRSFLLDAGAEYNGYAADLTRTYTVHAESEFAALIQDMHAQELALIATLKAGVCYIDYHEQMYQRLAKILKKHDLVRDISTEAMLKAHLITPFMPHGLGHFLGLQVHDVAGFMQDDKGTNMPAPMQYPWLRCTRVLEPRMVLTIEPGLYFIDSLLNPWREGEYAHYFNWQKIDNLKSYGGIRIEDNVVIHRERVENMTRDLNLL
ncbi:Xaa-Pro dipeptidase [Enterobacteriaceae bacterium LUAb1]